jgi:hypothetical protein
MERKQRLLFVKILHRTKELVSFAQFSPTPGTLEHKSFAQLTFVLRFMNANLYIASASQVLENKLNFDTLCIFIATEEPF